LSLLDDAEYIKALQSDDSSTTIARMWPVSEATVRRHRRQLGIKRVAAIHNSVTSAPGVSPDSKAPKVTERSENSQTGELSLTITHSKELTLADGDEWVRKAGKSPEDYSITVSSRAYGEGFWSNYIKATPKNNKPTVELPPDAAEWLESKITPVGRSYIPENKVGLPLVVCLSDFQTGKRGDGDGTVALINKFSSILKKITYHLSENPASEVVVVDTGDCIEGIFSSGGNAAVTNDLSLPDQLRIWQRMFTQAIISLAPYTGRLIAASVPSNHAEIRNEKGKVGYGDFGIGVLNQISDAFSLLNSPDLSHVEFKQPENEWDVVTYIQIGDALNAFTHGHHAKQDSKMADWVANQAAGRSQMKDATIVTHGHYHHRGYTWSRGREIISCPTLDGGSDWFENLSGEWSIPGILTYRIKGKYTTDMRFWEA
jgi:hypothetical protein